MPSDSRPRIALATYAKLPDLDADDRLLRDALAHAGAAPEAAVWDDPAVDWTRFDIVVVRTCWDYYLRPDAFAAWIDGVESGGARLVNPPALLRWNMDKRYLRALADDGVAVVETRWVEPGAHDVPLATLLGETGWERAVVKPAVSAGAHETWRTSRVEAAAHEPRFARLVAGAHAMVQPYLPEVETGGEWSLIFFGGEYSHAALKRPAQGDFRVQREHGGADVAAHPPAALVDDAAAVVHSAARLVGLAPSDIAYARVDGIARDGRLLLMELECLEPYLFLRHDPAAATRLARVVLGP